jgi:hypothetical protein
MLLVETVILQGKSACAWAGHCHTHKHNRLSIHSVNNHSFTSEKFLAFALSVRMILQFSLQIPLAKTAKKSRERSGKILWQVWISKKNPVFAKKKELLLYLEYVLGCEGKQIARGLTTMDISISRARDCKQIIMIQDLSFCTTNSRWYVTSSWT